MKYLTNFLLVLFVFLVASRLVCGFLLFPASTVLQITASVSAPIEIPGRKLFLDWGFQFNFDMPYSVKEFYNMKIWANQFKDRTARDLTHNAVNDTKWSNLHKYDENQSEVGHPSDFTAGELYESLENLLIRYGFHETCLLRSVCELARHPFADDQENMLTEILTFILTPSLHEAFTKREHLYREVYEDAERRGFLGEDCHNLYFECEHDILGGITQIIFENS